VSEFFSGKAGAILEETAQELDKMSSNASLADIVELLVGPPIVKSRNLPRRRVSVPVMGAATFMLPTSASPETCNLVCK